MSASDSLELQILDYLFGITAYTPPATWYIGLSSTDPGETGSTQTEPSGSNYARVAVTNNTTNWPAASAGSKSNGTVITFNTPSANWLAGANIEWFTLWDHATNTAAANFKGAGQLSTPQPALSGNVVRFPVSSLQISLA